MNRHLLRITLLTTMTVLTSLASAATISLNNSVGGHSANVSAGQSFMVTVQLNADQSFVGYSIYLDDPGYTTSLRFTVTNRTNLGTNPFTDSNHSDSGFTSDPVDAMTNDLGYTTDDSAAAAGIYNLETLTITPAAALAAGTYTIAFNSSSILSNATFQDVAYTSPTNYTVVFSTPEPTAAGVILLDSCVVLRRRRRGIEV